MKESGLLPLMQFMERLETIIMIMLGVTVVAFVVTAFYVCRIFDNKRNNDE